MPLSNRQANAQPCAFSNSSPAISATRIRKVNAKGEGEFLAWCEARGVASLGAIEPVHEASHVEHYTRTPLPQANAYEMMGRRDRVQGRQPHLPRNWHHCLSQERRHTKTGRHHGERSLQPHHPAQYRHSKDVSLQKVEKILN